MQTEYQLTAARVEEIFTDCLCTKDEVFEADEVRPVEGILNSYMFHPGRLQGHAPEIRSMLAELPEQFQQKTGGGWSFLNACNDRYGRQWTGAHRTMDRLFTLGQGIGAVKCVLPRDMWVALPGGMPYYVVGT